MLDHLRAHALAGNFAAGERILVAISEQSGSDTLVRAAEAAGRCDARAVDRAPCRDAARGGLHPRSARAADGGDGARRQPRRHDRHDPGRFGTRRVAEQLADMRATQLIIASRGAAGGSRCATARWSIGSCGAAKAWRYTSCPMRARRRPRAGGSRPGEGWGKGSDYALSVLFVRGAHLRRVAREPWISYNQRRSALSAAGDRLGHPVRIEAGAGDRRRLGAML